MEKSLDEIREDWENGYDEAEVVFESSDTVVVAAVHGEDYYDVLRYFHDGEKWAVSKDLQDGGSFDAIKVAVKAEK